MVQGAPEVCYLCCLCSGGLDPWVSPVKHPVRHPRNPNEARSISLLLAGFFCLGLLAWATIAAAAKTEFEVKCGKLDGKSMCLIDEATLDALINSNQRAVEAAKRCATQRQA